ncbi:hypothetical protein HHK36_025089 [Tetracentron sinense]|uniref:Transmembrane protein n=1 Tax=Tetracentron sinense TaxID=13715 RepID=A0A834YR80_TETSI|nr:hypothetical protein HHK36_025089 [Tetracentron sinense]
MGPALLSHLQKFWPFSPRKLDDLKVSDGLVRGLSIPEHTKQFVFAIREPESQAVIYILAAQNLSERSAVDAECLIKKIMPDAVVVQASPSALTEIQAEENKSRDDLENSVPTSSFGVLKGCFVNKINKEKYENVAGNLVLREIFGIGFHGHILAAKRAAEQVGSSVLLLESESVNAGGDPTGEPNVGNKFQAFVLQLSSLVPQKAGSVVSSSSKIFFLTNDLQFQIVKSLSSHLAVSASKSTPTSSVSEPGSGDFQLRCNYQAPSFAQSIYSLLTDLHDIFVDLPSIGRALAHVQKMLLHVDRGENVDTQLLSEVHTFRIAVEGLRIALNHAGRCPINRMENPSPTKIEFSELPSEDKSHVLLAQALRSQAKKFRSIVAVVDASSLAGLRKHWNTPVPLEVQDLVEQFSYKYESDEEISSAENTDRKRLLTDKRVVAVGAGATAVLGASSISKIVPASSFMKLITFHVPASLKLILTQTQKAATIVLSKTLGPAKLLAPGIASSGAKTTSALKATASAEKIRAVAHSMIASAEHTSFSAMRMTFYEIMRKRRVRPIGSMPWATFGCSVATCTGLLMYGDGIECAAESLPAAPSIACLGRGVRSLHQASQAVRQADSTKIQEAIQSLMCSLKKVKVQ